MRSVPDIRFGPQEFYQCEKIFCTWYPGKTTPVQWGFWDTLLYCRRSENHRFRLLLPSSHSLLLLFFTYPRPATPRRRPAAPRAPLATPRGRSVNLDFAAPTPRGVNTPARGPGDGPTAEKGPPRLRAAAQLRAAPAWTLRECLRPR